MDMGFSHEAVGAQQMHCCQILETQLNTPSCSAVTLKNAVAQAEGEPEAYFFNGL